MKSNPFVTTNNVKEFFTVAGQLARVEAGVPGMALVHGVKGLGKTTVAINYASQKANQAIYMRAKGIWTCSWMLEELLNELCVTPRRGEKAKFDDLVSTLAENPRLIIIDETNLVKDPILEALRAIHDLTHNPFLFIGHEGIVEKLMRQGPFYDRILYKAELKPLNLADLELFCSEALDVSIDGAALKAVLKETGGNFRKSVMRLKTLEDMATVGNLPSIDISLLDGTH